jgi:molecular chaperone DnaJ
VAPRNDWLEKDFYKVLGVSGSATEKEITRAYRKLAKQYHPDANPGDTAAETRFKEISEAYDVIGDDERRKEYDEFRRLGPVGGMFGGGGGAGGGFGGANFRVDDISDLLGGLFGRTQRGRGGAGPTMGPQRGADLAAELHLSFVDAVQGITTQVHVNSDATCHVCSGTGAAPGTSPVICPTCGGRGVTTDDQGMFSFSSTCRTCGGSGMKIETPCGNCHGSGVEQRARQVKVRIPAGVTNNQRIRLKGRGAAGRNGGTAGDLYVTVRVGGHPLFGRTERNLTLSVPVTFAEAALGTTVKVPTLTDPVTVRIPAGTQSGSVLRVRGRGVPSENNKTAGDLLVTVQVVVPKDLSDDTKAAIEALAAADPDEGGRLRSHLGV